MVLKEIENFQKFLRFLNQHAKNGSKRWECIHKPIFMNRTENITKFSKMRVKKHFFHNLIFKRLNFL